MNMRKLLNCLFFAFPFLLFAQVGIGRENPRGALDINGANDKNQYGLVLPTTSNPSLIKNPQTPTNSAVVPGTIIYDSTASCIRLYKQSRSDTDPTPGWSDCISVCED